MRVGPSQHAASQRRTRRVSSRGRKLSHLRWEGPIAKPLGTDGKANKLAQEVANEMQKNHQKIQLRKGSQHAMERWSGEGRGGTAKGPRESQKQEYLQQKTEKFHLLSSPDAPTKLETGKRQTDGEKNHVKPGIFISSLADIMVAKFLL